MAFIMVRTGENQYTIATTYFEALKMRLRIYSYTLLSHVVPKYKKIRIKRQIVNELLKQFCKIN